jgi:hypothetical protein
LQRINDNARHLQQWRDGAFAEGSAEWMIVEGLERSVRELMSFSSAGLD